LAGLGKLPQALEEYSVCEDQPGCPSWLYLALVAGIYDVVKQRDKAMESRQKSIQKHATPETYLSVANHFLCYERDASNARIAMREAEKGTMTDTAKPFYLRCRGVLAYLEGDYAAAQRELEASLDIVEKARNRPYRDGYISVAKAYLCCALAKQGQVVRAREFLEEAKDYLVATGADQLLAEANESLAARPAQL
jgi:tetratricopeptide (TPR) repeat protein